MTLIDFVNELAIDCENNVHFARQALVMDNCINGNLASKIKDKINSQNKNSRMVYVDLKEIPTFPDMLREMLIKIFDDVKFDNNDTLVSRDEFESENSEGELCYQFGCVVEEDFSISKIHLLIVLDNFEEASLKWSSSNFGWMRGLICDSEYLSILVISSKRINEISEEPVGSSPFYNIFEINVVDKNE